MLQALFGFQLGPGQGYVEALAPEQQHQVRASPKRLYFGRQPHYIRSPCHFVQENTRYIVALQALSADIRV